MELCNFLKSNNLDSFNKVKDVLSVSPYSLKIKEDNNYPDLYLLCYDRGVSDMSIPLVNECRGIILEKNTNRVVCYTFNKSVEYVHDNIKLDKNNEMVVSDGIDFSTVNVEESIDGTQIRLYYYNDSWSVATTRCIDAKRSYWYSEKSFYELFMDSCEGLDYSLLDKNYCYSFVLKHPENRIVVDYLYPALVHVGTRDLNTLIEKSVYIGINKPDKFKFGKFSDIVMSAMHDLPHSTEGYMLCDENYNRMKVRSSKYLDVKSMRGNSNNGLYHYFVLRQQNQLSNYMLYYPEDINQYKYYELNVDKIVGRIHREYMNKFINKSKNTSELVVVAPEVTWQFRPIIYKLHGEYMKTRLRTTKEVVYNYINMLEPAQLCFLYNKTYQS
jgi:hypothetical protein